MKGDLGDAGLKRDNARSTRTSVILTQGSFLSVAGRAARIVQCEPTLSVNGDPSQEIYPWDFSSAQAHRWLSILGST